MMGFLVFAVVGTLAWWITGRLAHEASFLRSLDHPNERSLHSEPTPRSGGIAILASILIGMALAAAGYALMPQSKGFLPKGFASASVWIVGSIALVTVVSFLDDRGGLPVWVRFGAQALAAMIVVWGVGLRLSSVPIPGVGTVALGWVAVPISILFLLWMTNLYNFMDGMDGFAGGMTVIGFGFLAFFGWRAGHPFMLLATLVVAASATGFLIHNFPPAHIFMGDIGSITLGFAAGALMLLGVRDRLFDIWVPLLIFSPFILDATVTLLRRAWRGARIWEGHREHYYQRLVLSGWSHRRSVLVEYGLMVWCGGLAIAYRSATDRWRVAILLVWMATFAGLAWAVHRRESRADAGRG